MKAVGTQHLALKLKGARLLRVYETMLLEGRVRVLAQCLERGTQ